MLDNCLRGKREKRRNEWMNRWRECITGTEAKVRTDIQSRLRRQSGWKEHARAKHPETHLKQ